jgi:hypothetical protein
MDNYDGDFTGDPVLDQQGYQSPTDKGNRTGFRPGERVDWLGQGDADRAKRRARRQGRPSDDVAPAERQSTTGTATLKLLGWLIGTAIGLWLVVGIALMWILILSGA